MIALAQRVLDRFPLEEINGGERCPTYMYRWTLLRVPRAFSVYLHRFVADDWSRDLHDHPKRFISIGLRGRYLEETPDGLREYRAPWVRTFAATHRHRISVPHGDAWTLVIVGPAVREWGFWPNGRWMQWKDYLRSKHADNAKACQ